jgi:uncharacterized DUF497 family protein
VSLVFEWDSAKAEENRRKHGVTFDEAASAFADTLSMTILDPDHSETEERFVLVGLSARNRLVVVVHTERDDRVRIVSARLASSHERRDYEQGG